MCLLCDTPKPMVHFTITSLHICDKINELPNTLTNIRVLHCNNNKNIIEIPREYSKLISLEANNTGLKSLPPTLIKLSTLWIGCTEIEYLPDEFTKLEVLYINDTKIKSIPESYKILKRIFHNNENLIIPNNLKYLINK
jgi:hypothetical protein